MSSFSYLYGETQTGREGVINYRILSLMGEVRKGGRCIDF